MSVLLLFSLISLELQGQKFRFTTTRPAMGTPWQITLYASDTLTANQLTESAFARIEAIEQIASDYRPDSEINLLKSLPARRDHLVSKELFTLLSLSKQLAKRSRGAYDPTIGPLSKLWRRAFRHQRFPSEIEINRARTRVRWKYLRLRRPGLVSLRRDSISLDLGGIAKGYALDAVAQLLIARGVKQFLIDGGGDLLLGDPPPGRSGWTVVTPAGRVDTANVAIATSGGNYHYLEHEGQRYSHLIDPRTGLGVTHGEALTVFAPTATVADGLASALSVMSRGRLRLVTRYGDVLFITTQEDKLYTDHATLPAASPRDTVDDRL